MRRGTPSSADDVRDELPEDLDASGFVGAYQFPDNSRRRIPGAIYLGAGGRSACVPVTSRADDRPCWSTSGSSWAAVILRCGRRDLSITSGWRMHVDEKQALVAAQQAVGFPVGHASAQQVWRGLRSRPTWRVLCYSAEDPPRSADWCWSTRSTGTVLQQLVEDNPEEWRPSTNSSSRAGD